MARVGLTKSQVRAIRDRLLAEGTYPSADAVRRALGDTGSKSTIHKYLKELADEDPGAGIKRQDTGRQLLTVVEQLADQLHADAEARIQALRTEFDRVLRAKDRELVELRNTMAALEARLENAQNKTVPSVVRASPPTREIERRGEVVGFGDFSALLSNSRCAGRDVSPFGVILTGTRSEILDLERVNQPRLKLA